MKTIDEGRKALCAAALQFAEDPVSGLQPLCVAAAEYQDARLRAASGATASANAGPVETKPPKTKACRDCGEAITWGVFGSGKAACIAPESLAGGYEVRPGKFGPVPHFQKSRGHMLHDCPNRRAS